MLNNQVYYHGIIRKSIVAFGRLFSDIYIDRKQGDSVAGNTIQRLQVPLSYAPKEKWIVRLDSDPNLEQHTYTTLPRMSFELVAMNYDQMRKLTNAQKITGLNTSGKNDRIRQRITAPVPYNLDFSLYIQTKNLNDGWQIIEQILPYFSPAYTVRVRHFPSDYDSETPIMENEYDMPFTLLATSWADDWTGDISDIRTIEWNLEFQTKVWLAGPAATTSVIYDSRTILSTPPNGVDINTMTRASDQIGTELGHVAIGDSETPIFEINDFISPNIINTTDSDGNIVKIIRSIDTI